ncbi:MAG: iron ABC transporter permease [Treponema sp.]|jgi:iron(III) transport system permease protein|nr:iron ABC transporter permease [Treponema sp.]
MRNFAKRSWRELKALAGDPVLLFVVTLIFVSLILFIVYPLIKVILVSFKDGGGYGLGVFKEVFSSRYLGQAFRNSILMGVLTALAGCVLGFLFAYAIARTDIPLKKLFHIIAIIPVVSPPFIGAMSIIMLFGNNGLVTYSLLGIKNYPIYGFQGLLIAQVITFFPVAYITLRGVIESISPTLEDAALDLGGSRWKVFRKVTLPLTAPGIASAMLVLFIETMADFGNPLILAGSQFPILSVQAYMEITGMFNLPKGSAIAFLLLVPSITAYFLQKYWVSRKQYVTITGKPTSSQLKSVSPAAKWVLFGFCLLVAAFILLIYITIVWGAFAKVWGFDSSPTLEHFKYVFGVGFRAVKDTLVIAGLSTPAAGILGMVIAFLVVRKHFPGKKLMEFTSMLSFAVPGTVIGIGYILAFNQRPLLLTGTLMILLLNFIYRYIPVGIQSGVAILQQVDPSIEEAAIDLGADSRKTFSKITLPLMVPAFFSGLIFSFVRAMTAISAAIFLVSSRWNLMTVQIMSQVDSGRLGAAAAFSLILVAMILIAMFLIRTVLVLLYGRAGGTMLKI